MNSIPRIKHFSELPKWFKLEKYEKANKLDAAGWYEQLIVRDLCYLKCSKYPAFWPEISPEQRDFRSAIKLIRENPIVDVCSNEHISKVFLQENINLAQLKAKKIQLLLPVHPMALSEFDILKRCILPDRCDYIENWHDELLKFDVNAEELTYYPWLHESVINSFNANADEFTEMRGIAHLIINTNFPDETLIEGFKRFLATHRASTPSRFDTNQKKPDFKEWEHLKLLPYLDLKLWEREEQVTIPYRVIADALFPLGDGGEETIRKTLATHVKSIMTTANYNYLLAMAAQEIEKAKTQWNQISNLLLSENCFFKLSCYYTSRNCQAMALYSAKLVIALNLLFYSCKSFLPQNYFSLFIKL